MQQARHQLGWLLLHYRSGLQKCSNVAIVLEVNMKNKLCCGNSLNAQKYRPDLLAGNVKERASLTRVFDMPANKEKSDFLLSNHCETCELGQQGWLTV